MCCLFEAQITVSTAKNDDGTESTCPALACINYSMEFCRVFMLTGESRTLPAPRFSHANVQL